jgi:hypothetical protein
MGLIILVDPEGQFLTFHEDQIQKIEFKEGGHGSGGMQWAIVRKDGITRYGSDLGFIPTGDVVFEMENHPLYVDLDQEKLNAEKIKDLQESHQAYLNKAMKEFEDGWEIKRRVGSREAKYWANFEVQITEYDFELDEIDELGQHIQFLEALTVLAKGIRLNLEETLEDIGAVETMKKPEPKDIKRTDEDDLSTEFYIMSKDKVQLFSGTKAQCGEWLFYRLQTHKCGFYIRGFEPPKDAFTIHDAGDGEEYYRGNKEQCGEWLFDRYMRHPGEFTIE